MLKLAQSFHSSKEKVTGVYYGSRGYIPNGQMRKSGVNINDEDSSHLSFADDILLFADKVKDLQTMLSALKVVPKNTVSVSTQEKQK